MCLNFYMEITMYHTQENHLTEHQRFQCHLIDYRWNIYDTSVDRHICETEYNGLFKQLGCTILAKQQLVASKAICVLVMLLDAHHGPDTLCPCQLICIWLSVMFCNCS